MTKTIIADSSPLIVLLKSGLENILPELFDEFLVPEALEKVQVEGFWLSDAIIEMLKDKAEE